MEQNDDNASVGGESLAAYQNPNATMDVKNPMEEIKEAVTTTAVVTNPQFPTYGAASPRHAPAYMQGHHGSFQTGTLERDKIEAEERQEKARIIQRLQRLNSRKDFPSIQFSESDSLSTLRRLNSVATSAGRAKMSIDLIKRCTIFIARVMEGLCEKFPNKYIDLQGYSEHLVLTISTYDALLYDVYEFYSDTLAEMSPLLTYLGAIGSNLIMYSISRRIMGASSSKKKDEEEAKQAAERQREDEILQMLSARSKLAALRQQQDTGASGPSDRRDDDRPRRPALSISGPDDSDNESAGFKSVKSTEDRHVRFKSEDTKHVDPKPSVTIETVDDGSNKMKLDLSTK